MTSAIVFDDGVSLGPLTDLRASFEVRTGALTTLERLEVIAKKEIGARVAGVWATAPMALVMRERDRTSRVNDRSTVEKASELLLINGRSAAVALDLKRLRVGSAYTVGGAVVAARLKSADAMVFLETMALPGSVERIEVDASAARLLEQPWDVIRWRDEAIDFDLEVLAKARGGARPAGVVVLGSKGVHVGKRAEIARGVVLDAKKGRIVIGAGAVVRPGSVIVGPAYIGEGTTVLERTLIKAHTAIGPVCKVAGEVGGTIFQAYSNKAHDGHLGDAWVGEWANFGAGTTNSNLLNTYGEIVSQASPDARRMKTGLKFLGCIVGDHVKFAILTRIMTGAVFGTGSMIAKADAPTCVGRFEWITEERRQPYRWDRFEEVARAVFARRGMTMGAAYAERLSGLAG